MKSKAKILAFLIIFLVGCEKDSVFDIFRPDFEVFVLLPSEGLGDRSFVDVVYEGIEAAKTDFDFSVQYVIPDDVSEGEKWIKNIPDLKSETAAFSLIIIAGSQFTGAIDSLNGQFGPHKILFLGGTAKKQEGLASVVYRTYGASYIGGYLSAQLVPDCRAVVIEGFDASFLSDYQVGFKDGVTDAGGTVLDTEFVSDGFSGFEMPDSAYRLTNKLLPRADLIFALAAGSNSGIIDAARNYSEQRYVIGVDADQSWMGRAVVTGSVIKLFDLDIFEYIDQFSRNSFQSGNIERTLEEGRTAFLVNEVVLEETEITDDLVEMAVERENQYYGD